MNDRLEQCRKTLAGEIQSAEASLAKAVGHLKTSSETGVATLESGLKETLAQCEATREQAENAGRRVKCFIEESASQALSRFEDWKTDREISKLEKHADEAEQQAVDAILVAAHALLQAEAAIVEALRARKVAIEVAG
jgi:hypothetical protein